MKERHGWSIVDAIISFCLCNYSIKKIDYSYGEISNKFVMSGNN